MKHVDALIHARWTIPVEPAGLVLEHHTLVVNQGRIEALIATNTVKQLYSSDQHIERPTHVLLPGLVNAHTRAASVLLRGAAENPFAPRWADPEFVRDGTQLGIAAMLRAGITCFADVHLYPEVVAQTAAAAHMRACIGLAVTEEATHWAQSAEECINKGLLVRDEYQGDPLISTVFAPRAVRRLSDEVLQRIRLIADKIEIPVIMTLHRTAQEVQAAERPLDRIERLGLLTPLLCAGHMTHLSPADIDKAANAGISIIHSPQADLEEHNGVCPVQKLWERGINVALGSGAASNRAIDLLEEMRTAALLAGGLGGPSLTAHDILRMATLNGARALGLAGEIGSLVPGKWADLCCIDLADPQTQPVYDPAGCIVYQAGRAQVSDAWVAGRHLLNAAQLTRMNLPELLALSEQWRQRIEKRS